MNTMKPDPRFVPGYNEANEKRERVHNAMLDYMDNPQDSMHAIADRHNLTQSQLAKHISMYVLPENRRGHTTGKKPQTEPSDKVKKILLDAAEHGHAYSALTNETTAQMSRYYKYRWRHWLAEQGL